MINRKNSLLISLVIHILLFLLLLLIWEKNFNVQADTKEKKIYVDLCKVKSEKQTQIKKEQAKKVQIPKSKPKLENIKTPIKKEIVEEVVEEPLKKPMIEEENLQKPTLKKKEEVPEEEISKENLNKPLKEHKTEQKSTTKEYIEINKQKIAELLQENLYYPRSARKRGIEGEVTVSFKLDIDGTTSDIQIINSQSDILSKAAVKTISDLSGKLPKPKNIITLKVPIGYKLR